MNKEKIIKLIPTILCILMLVSLILPFVSYGANVSILGASASSETSLNGFDLISEGSFLAILLPLMPILIMVATYIKNLAPYKKYICLGASAFTIIWLFIVPKISGGASAEGVSIDYNTSYLIGFWIMLICAIALTFLYLIPFINKNNNAVLTMLNPFDDEAVSNGNTNNDKSDDNSKINISQINVDKDKIAGFAKNMADTISEQGKNIVTKATEQAKNVVDNVSTKSNMVSQNTRKENPEEIMEQLKKLNELKESGILTDEEFTAKKQEMLERM